MKVSTIKGWYKEYAKSCETVAKFLAKKLKVKPNSKITELGCGEGAFTIPLAREFKNSQIIAIDKDRKALEKLKSNVKRFGLKNVAIMKGDARKLMGIENDSIDVVISHWLFGVITKHEDVKQIIKENYRILKKGGLVVHSESSPVCKNKAQWLYMKSDMLAFRTRWWDPKKIEKIMKRIGFRKITMEFIDFKIRIIPKISIPLVREWQKLEYSFTGKKQAIFNPKLESFLKIHENEIERHGLEFPTEYIVIATK
jgi:ubiquinone/menaquinone biosynthesis C-methylase UbiE